MKKFFILLMTVLMAVTAKAQVINGDLNHNGDLDVDDVTLLIDGYLTGETEAIKPTVNPYMVDNSLVAGTWYSSKTNSTIFNADGTFGGILQGLTYKYMPFQRHILMYNPDGSFAQKDDVLELTADSMLLKWPDGTCHLMTRTQPKEYVSSIELSRTSVWMDPNTSVQLRVAVYPTYADDPRVSWSSSDEWVATVDNGTVYAHHGGTATNTCEALDGSGVKATCAVTVKSYNNGYEYVDLGLSVKWATMNIGANASEEYGDYFAWGETEPKDYYDWSTYKWCKGSYNTLTKYCIESDYGTVDNKTVLELSDDAAHANWGSTWRMPTSNEFQELRTECSWEWTTQNGVNGMKVTGPNGNSIFLPAAGYRNDSNDSSLSSVGNDGHYWSSSLDKGNRITPSSLNAHDVGFEEYAWHYRGTRAEGKSVRAVCP